MRAFISARALGSPVHVEICSLAVIAEIRGDDGALETRSLWSQSVWVDPTTESRILTNPELGRARKLGLLRRKGRNKYLWRAWWALDTS